MLYYFEITTNQYEVPKILQDKKIFYFSFWIGLLLKYIDFI